jgi:Protein of unknown function (DUF3828)
VLTFEKVRSQLHCRSGAFVLLCLCVISVPTEISSQKSEIKSVRAFAQSFYDWYVQVVSKENSTPAWILAIRQKRSLFSDRLVKALNEESEEQGNSQGALEGLDFDPFLNSQDPSGKYQIGEVKWSGGHYDVEVRSFSEGKSPGRPSLIAEVSSGRGHLWFRNFRYEQNQDLLGVLKRFKTNRDSAPRRHQ